ncbi:MAG TPA: hypothetical protein VFO68_32005 [Actinophytocola sp.]|nr:hypothetical protein [Actinophytocola sp.]
MSSTIAYTPEQRARAFELWERILTHRVFLREERYGSAPTSLAAKHVAALIDSDGAATDEFGPVTVTLVSYSDYGGSDLDAANVRALGELPGVSVTAGGAHGEDAAWLQLGELPVLGAQTVDDGLDRLQAIVDALGRIAENGLLDDEVHTAYIDELTDQAWEAWLGWDVISDLEPVAPEGFALSETERCQIRAAYYAFDGNEWVAETATSVTNYRHDHALAHAASTVLGWDYPSMKASHDAEQERAAAQRTATEHRWQWEHETFRAVWAAFLAAYPVPALSNATGPTRDYQHRTAFGQLHRAALTATVANLLTVVQADAEQAAYRDRDRRTAGQGRS